MLGLKLKTEVQKNKRKVCCEKKSTKEYKKGLDLKRKVHCGQEVSLGGPVGSSRLPSWPSDVLFIIGVIVITAPFVIIIVITIIIINRSCAALWAADLGWIVKPHYSLD